MYIHCYHSFQGTTAIAQSHNKKAKHVDGAGDTPGMDSVTPDVIPEIILELAEREELATEFDAKCQC